jgi:hypothetical protein
MPKTTLVKFPNEPLATLSFGDHQIEMSQTFVNELILVLRNRHRVSKFEPDIAHFEQKLRVLDGALFKAGRVHTDAEWETAVQHSLANGGAGYWSSWMDHGDPFGPSLGPGALSQEAPPAPDEPQAKAGTRRCDHVPSKEDGDGDEEAVPAA